MNEWFTISSVVLVLAIALFLPKRFSAVLTTTIVVFNVFLSQAVDYLIAVRPVDLYDTGKLVYSPLVYFGVYVLNILMFHATQSLLRSDRVKKRLT